MIWLIVALCLFLFVGKTGQVVRKLLTALFCNIIVYFGVPLFAIMLYYWKVN